MLDQDVVRIQGWGNLTRAQIVLLASDGDPFRSVQSFKDLHGRKVCPVALVELSDWEWLNREFEAREYGRTVEWDDETSSLFAIIRQVKAETDDALDKALRPQGAQT